MRQELVFKYVYSPSQMHILIQKLQQLLQVSVLKIILYIFIDAYIHSCFSEKCEQHAEELWKTTCFQIQ